MNVFVLFCFTVLSCECILLCVLCCLPFIDIFHIHMQLMQSMDQWNENVCMCVCTPVLQVFALYFSEDSLFFLIVFNLKWCIGVCMPGT